MGVALELCGHARGDDVDLIMEARLNIYYIPGISSSYIWGLVLCNRGYDHDCSPLVLFLRQVKVLTFYRLIRLPNLYSSLPSSFTLWYLKNISELHNSI